MVRWQAIRDGPRFESECQSANFIEAWQVDRQVGNWLLYIYIYTQYLCTFWVGSHLERFQLSACFLVDFFLLLIYVLSTPGEGL